MKIVLDLQACQTESRYRGIGRYSLSLAQAMARHSAGHEIWVALNGLFPATVEPLRAALDAYVPQDRIVAWSCPGEVAEVASANRWRQQAAESVRELSLAQLNPDILHVASLFEGWGDNAVTSINSLESNPPTAMTLYDLIPLLHEDMYLQNPLMRQWYYRKLEELRKSDYWLAISEHTKKSVIEKLGLQASKVTNIGFATDEIFKPKQLSVQAQEALFQRYGLSRSFLMYTGGFDQRKNIERLIKAFAELPDTVRSQYHLLLAGKVPDVIVKQLHRVARQAGLNKNEMVLCGYVPDEDLVALYNLCELFVFPSWCEGAGLPPLEAMACGAAVVGANASSVPEVIARTDMLFDPYDIKSISEKIYEVLSNPAYKAELSCYGVQRSAEFSWESCAKRVLDFFEARYAETQENNIFSLGELQKKPSIAYVSALGVCAQDELGVAIDVLTQLATLYELELIVDAENAPKLTGVSSVFTLRTKDWFLENVDRYQQIIYDIANAPVCRFVYELAVEYPGVLIVNDFSFDKVFEGADKVAQSELLVRALCESQGYKALGHYFSPSSSEYKFLCNTPLFEHQDGIITNSLCGIRQAVPVLDNKCLLVPATDCLLDDERRLAMRATLGWKADSFIIYFSADVFDEPSISFLQKILKQTPLNVKNVHLLLTAIFEDSNDDLGSFLSSLSTEVKIHRIEVCNQNRYEEHMNIADLAIVAGPRFSAQRVLECMKHGLPAMGFDGSASVSLLNGGLLGSARSICIDMAVDTVMQCYRDPAFLSAIRAQLGEHVKQSVRPQQLAELYAAAVERLSARGRNSLLKGTVGKITSLDSGRQKISQADWYSVAEHISLNEQRQFGPGRLFVDVSEIVTRDDKTGIQRVVRSVLSHMLGFELENIRIEPVYCDGAGVYRHARQFLAGILNYDSLPLADELIEPTCGDVFLGLDLAVNSIPSKAEYFSQLRARGVRVYFVVYDLLPTIEPKWFPPGIVALYMPWLDVVTQYTDGAICISRSVADDLKNWLDRKQVHRERPFHIAYFHLGADISNSLPSGGVSDGFEESLAVVRAQPTFLMVGTIEPRKGYAQALAAFDLLWSKGTEVCLVIVAKQGWSMDELVAHLRNHPQRNKRLFWFEGASDEMLLTLYEEASAVLVASEGEGFGLPLIEAAQHKLSIVARDLRVFREVAGEHAYYFDGYTPESLVSALEQWLANAESNTQPGSGDMPWITWQQSASQLLAVIQDDSWYTKWMPGTRFFYTIADPCVDTAVGKADRGFIRATGEQGLLLISSHEGFMPGEYRLRLLGNLCCDKSQQISIVIINMMQKTELLSLDFDMQSLREYKDCIFETDLMLDESVSRFEICLKVGHGVGGYLEGVELTPAKSVIAPRLEHSLVPINKRVSSEC